MLAIFPTIILLTCILQNSWYNLGLFVTFAVAGVFGETLFSAWWFSFFGKRFWAYSVETLFNKFTSFLNFIPWGIGGMIYTFPLPHYFDTLTLAKYFITIFPVLVLLQYFFKYFFTRTSYFYFFLPVLLFSITLLFINIDYLLVIIFFLTIPALCEYLFGKATERVISKKMWTYNYCSYDKGHFTPLSMPAFLLAGYYFIFIKEIFNFFI
jgi:hypothetical protein